MPRQTFQITTLADGTRVRCDRTATGFVYVRVWNSERMRSECFRGGRMDRLRAIAVRRFKERMK